MRTKTALLFSIAALATFASGVTAKADISLNGGGSSFDLPAFTKWFQAYRSVDSSVSFNYQPNGSGFGQSSMLNQTVDFGASDFTMDDAKLAKSTNGPILQIPIVAGAVVISYNLPGNPKLKLDGEIIADIYLGNITKWNDPRIVALIPDKNLPDLDIVTVHRSDTSGTSYIFSDYLSAVSKQWASQVGRSGSPMWPNGLGGKANAGVAGQVKQLPGAVGYIELAYAVENHLPYAKLKNHDGDYVEATPGSVSAALATATIPDDFRFTMVNAPGAKSYPIAGVSWMLLYQNQKDSVKGAAIVKFAKWIVTEGQTISPTLEYAPLPKSVQERILAAIDTIKM